MEPVQIVFVCTTSIFLKNAEFYSRPESLDFGQRIAAPLCISIFSTNEGGCYEG